MKRILLLTVAVMTFFAVTAFKGCTNWESTTYQALATSQSALNNAEAAYEISAATGNCTAALTAKPPIPCIPHTSAAFKSITDGKVAWKTATDGMIAYETIKNASPAPTADALTKAQADVAAALTQVGTIVKDIENLYVISKGGL